MYTPQKSGAFGSFTETRRKCCPSPRRPAMAVLPAAHPLSSPDRARSLFVHLQGGTMGAIRVTVRSIGCETKRTSVIQQKSDIVTLLGNGNSVTISDLSVVTISLTFYSIFDQ